jgi:hypothetical protein
MRQLGLLAALAVVAISGGLLTTAGAQPPGATVMTGLDNPRGIVFGPGGGDDDDDDDGGGSVLYVAEAGEGGSGPCVTPPPPPPRPPECYGPTGAISQLRRGVQRRIVTGLPSHAPAGGNEATGPHDLTVRGGIHVTLGLAMDPALRPLFGPGGSDFGKLVRIRGNGWRAVADLAAYEAARNPDNGPPDSNPYGLLRRDGGHYVAEAGGNTLLRVRSNGRISTVAVLPSRPQGRDTDSVPTVVVRGPDGKLYVGELTGFPFPPGAARIYRIVDGTAEIWRMGFTMIVDMVFAPDGSLYVLQYSTGGPPQTPPGSVVRVEATAPHTTVITGLEQPTSLAFGPDCKLYVTNHGASANIGEVLRFDVGEQCRRDDDDDEDDDD